MTSPDSQTHVEPVRHPAWVWMLGPGVVFVLVLTYLVFPTFYLEWVLSFHGREGQIVEYLTFGAALGAAALLLRSAWRLRAHAGVTWGERGGVIVIALTGLAALFFAGEEVSWGQWIFHWDTPDAFRETIGSGETNLHNADLPINLNSLGSLFLIIVFLVLPAVWNLRWPTTPPATWRPAIAEGPVICVMVCGFAWKEIKGLYRFANPDYESLPVYIDFFEQINEHKELLVAVALLMYGIYRVRAARQWVSVSRP